MSPRKYIYALHVWWDPYDNTFNIRGRKRFSHKKDIDSINKVVITKNDDFYVRIRGFSYSKAWDDAKKLIRPVFMKSNVLNVNIDWDYIDDAIPFDFSKCHTHMREHFPYTPTVWETRFTRENPMWDPDWSYNRYHYVARWINSNGEIY